MAAFTATPLGARAPGDREQRVQQLWECRQVLNLSAVLRRISSMAPAKQYGWAIVAASEPANRPNLGAAPHAGTSGRLRPRRRGRSLGLWRLSQRQLGWYTRGYGHRRWSCCHAGPPRPGARLQVGLVSASGGARGRWVARCPADTSDACKAWMSSPCRPGCRAASAGTGQCRAAVGAAR